MSPILENRNFENFRIEIQHVKAARIKKNCTQKLLTFCKVQTEGNRGSQSKVNVRNQVQRAKRSTNTYKEVEVTKGKVSR